MASSSSSSSSISGSNPPKYDVFLSFRGEDTRKNFTSHLNDAFIRSGIVTFIDNREVEKGDEISSTLSTAIRSSSFWIIIFSQNYASSSWCLNELLEILECYETTQTRRQIILPIFYHVSPSDIRKQNGTYGKAFAKHEERSKETKDKVQKWRAALTKVAELSGWDLKPDDEQLETEFIEKIVKDVLAKLNRISSGDHLDPGLVGIRSRVETVESLLWLESTDICMVGIWGMGGIGKTTIARALRNRIASQFTADCFLEIVRDDAKIGPNQLQKKLLSEILGEGNHCINDFTIRRLRTMKILIVIDNVEDSKHLKALVGDRSWFGPGSKIIVTSRDKQVLKNGVDEFKLYEVEGLNDDEALQLFSLNAFKQSHPPEDFMEMSVKVIHYAKGNPLALEVLGSSLFKKEMVVWESLLDKLKKGPDREILRVLRISYDMLDFQEREIFLFIACFFKGEERGHVTTILNGCKFNGCEFSVSGLVDKCLLTITYDNRLSMHDLIQQMGCDVVFQESVNEPGKRSRLWDPQDICDLFKKNKGTEAVESISLDLTQISELYISPDAFTRMPNLKLLKFYFSTSDYLRYHKWRTASDDWRCDRRTALDDWRYDKWRKELNKVKIIGEGLESLPDELRYVSWPGYPLKYLPLKPEHLVDLEMPFSKLQHLWKDTKFLGKKLRRIDLRECRELTEVPELYQATNLESMQLGWCSTLTKFPKISSHVTLTRLCLSETAIEEVPYSAIKCLSKIVELDMGYNTRLRNLPSMRHLTSLETLDLNGCSNITEFPDVSGAITSLYLSGTAIEEVPYSAIKSLSKIVSLDMGSNTMLRNLPSMCHLTSLERLDLNGCSNITKFPDVSGAITGLYLSGTAIEEVPCSAIKSLSKIVSLTFHSNTRLRNLPSMRHLTSLEYLFLTGSSNITEFPDVSGAITHLHLNGTGIEEVPYSAIKSLSKIVELNMRSNTMLRNLPNMCHLTSLKRLYLSGCSNITEFPEILGKITYLDLSETGIEEIPSSVERLTNLEYLTLKHCKRLKKVSSCIFQLKLFRGRLDLSGCSKLENFVEVLENEGMLPSSRIHELSLRHCKNINLESLPNSKFNLSELDLSGCPGVEKKLENVLLSSPSGLRSLRDLNLSECNMEVLPSALSCLSSLDYLLLRGNEFESLSLELFTSLTKLDISHCQRLRNLQDFRPSRLNVLVASNCTSLETLPDTNGVSASSICYYYYYFNCFKLDKSARVNIQAYARLKTQLKCSEYRWPAMIKYQKTNVWPDEKGRNSFCFPGSEIPKWFINQNQTSSIKIDLPPHWYSNKFVGFVVCIVASCESSSHIGHSYVQCECKIKDSDCDRQDIIFRFPKTVIQHPMSDHVFIESILPETVFVDRKSDGECFKMTDGRFNTENSFSWQKARFRFSTSKEEEEDCHSESDSCCKVKKCGINLVYSEWEEEDCHSHEVIGKEEEEDCHSESEEEDCHSHELMMLSERRKKKIATQNQKKKIATHNQKLIPSADRVKEEPKLDKHFFFWLDLLFIFFFYLFVMFIFHSLNIYK